MGIPLREPRRAIRRRHDPPELTDQIFAGGPAISVSLTTNTPEDIEAAQRCVKRHALNEHDHRDLLDKLGLL